MNSAVSTEKPKGVAIRQVAEELVRTHALGLADHVSKYADYLD